MTNDQGWLQWAMEANAATSTASLTPGPANPQPVSFGDFPVRPDFDLIELLPPAAQEKLRALRQRSADAHAVIPTGFDVQTASAERVAAENAVRRLVDHPHQHGFGLPDDDRRVQVARQHLAKMTDEFQRIKERSEQRTQAWQAASGALQAVESWLRDGRPHGTVLEDHEIEVPKLAKGESGLLDAIENRRRRVRELRADLHRIRSAPYPSSHAKAQMRAQVEALAMQGAPNVSDLIEHDRQIVWPTTNLRSQVYNTEVPSVAFAEVPDTVALFAWLHRDALIKRLDAEIESEADDKAALTHEAREKAEVEVQTDLLDIERQEAALVTRGMDERLPVEHRSDINPVALLGIALVTASRTNGSTGGSSPMHAWDIVGGRPLTPRCVAS